MYALFAAVPLIGHINPLLRQADALAQRGWRVAFAGPSETRAHVAAEAPRVPFLDLGPLGAIGDALRRAQEAASADGSFARGTATIVSSLSAVWPLMFDGLAAAIGRDRPSVMVVDLFSPAGMCAAEAAGVPFVVNNPDLLAALSVKLLPPADHLPWLFSGRSIRQTGRLQRALAPLLRRLAVHLVSRRVGGELNVLRASRGLPPVDVHEWLRGRTILVNGAFGLEYERPLPADVHMVGAMLPAETPALPPDLARWLDEAAPVVYANLGTLAVPSAAQLGAMLEAFTSEAFRVLWILKEPQQARLPRRLPANVRVLAWGPPPLAVLGHDAVRAFVTHCGINSVHEGVHAGTPMVGIPMFADQRDMAVRMADAGIGVWLDKRRLDASRLGAAIRAVLEDDAFRARMPAVQAALERAGGVRRAADLTERAVRK